MLNEPVLAGQTGQGIDVVGSVFVVIIQKIDIENRAHPIHIHPVAKFLHTPDGAVIFADPVIDKICFALVFQYLLPDFPFHPVPVLRMDQGGKGSSRSSRNSSREEQPNMVQSRVLA